MSALPPKRPKPPKQEPANETHSFYGPRRLWKELARIAEVEGFSSTSELVTAVLEKLVEDYRAEKQATEDGASLP